MAKNRKGQSDIPKNRLAQLRMGGVVLTQEEVAKLMGLDHTTVSKHESGGRSMSREVIRMYAKLYKCETWEIFMDPSEVVPAGHDPVAATG